MNRQSQRMFWKIRNHSYIKLNIQPISECLKNHVTLCRICFTHTINRIIRNHLLYTNPWIPHTDQNKITSGLCHQYQVSWWNLTKHIRWRTRKGHLFEMSTKPISDFTLYMSIVRLLLLDTLVHLDHARERYRSQRYLNKIGVVQWFPWYITTYYRFWQRDAMTDEDASTPTMVFCLMSDYFPWSQWKQEET